MLNVRIYASTVRPFGQLSKLASRSARRQTPQSILIVQKGFASVRKMSNNIAYKLNEAGGVDYQESRGGDKARPQLPPDVTGAEGGGEHVARTRLVIRSRR